MTGDYLELLEQLFDKIADTLIESSYVNPERLELNQKTIRSGIIQTARTSSSETLVLYQKDIKANEEDLQQYTEGGLTLDIIAQDLFNSNATIDDIKITVTSEGLINLLAPNFPPYDNNIPITSLLSSIDENGVVNPVNISQFVNIEQKKSTVSIEQANEFLDTNIFELLSGPSSRQERINNFFDEFQSLVGGVPFSETSWPDVNPQDGSNDLAIEYDNLNDITQNPNNANAFITRLDRTVEQFEDTQNEAQTLESLRNILNQYLRDIDDELVIEPTEQRPTYQNQSSGYLKFRNLNQGIIIRNVNNDFVEGLNPETRDYLSTGFTITMWVRFLDKVSEGTLFNFGNPTRVTNPIGFKLDTLIENEKRYLRLLVLDNDGMGVGSTAGTPYYYDSHRGFPLPKVNIGSNVSALSNVSANQYLEVPMDFTDWYFICATYNPNVNEINSQNVADIDYWNNNMLDNESTTPSNEYVQFSGFGNRSKVEIISRSDLLRARGFNLETTSQS